MTTFKNYMESQLCCECQTQPKASARTDGRCYYCGKIKDGLIKPETHRFNTGLRDQLRKVRST